MKFRRRTDPVDAIRFTGGNLSEVIEFCSGCDTPLVYIYGDLVIRTLEGDMIVSKGDWVIRGTVNEYYPCKPDIFQTIYEPECATGAAAMGVPLGR